MKAVAVTYVLSWQHAMRIVRKLSTRKHRPAGYTFDLKDLGIMERDWSYNHRHDQAALKQLYSDLYKPHTMLFKLIVYKETT